MPEGTTVEVDPVFVEWTDLCMLVTQKATFEGFQRWAFVVGTEGTVQDRLTRGRTAWARWGKAWSKQEQGS